MRRSCACRGSGRVCSNIRVFRRVKPAVTRAICHAAASSQPVATDGLTDLLRTAWRADPQPGHADGPVRAGPDSIQLHTADAAGMGTMTLWDMLSGKFQSRVPGMDVFNERVRPPRWTAWDPCSKNRSRCAHGRCAVRALCFGGIAGLRSEALLVKVFMYVLRRVVTTSRFTL